MNKLLIAALFLMASSGSVFAVGTVNNYKVDYVRVDKNGKGFVRFTSALLGTPATCINPSYANMLAFDTNTPGGQGILSLVLSAKASGGLVSANGTGGCTIYNPTMEDWSWGYIK